MHFVFAFEWRKIFNFCVNTPNFQAKFQESFCYNQKFAWKLGILTKFEIFSSVFCLQIQIPNSITPNQAQPTSTKAPHYVRGAELLQ